MRKKGVRGVTTVERSGVWDAEDSCSVRAAPFSRPVRPVFVTSDVSIKTRATTRNNPLPATGLPLRPPCPAGISTTFHPRPCPRLPLSFSPSLRHIHTQQRALLSLRVTLQKKSSGDRSRNIDLKLRSCISTPDADF